MNKHRKATLKERLRMAAEKEAPEAPEETETAPEEVQEVPFAESDLDAHFRNLEAQARAAQQFYPELDLARELQNPLFARLTQPLVGMEVAEAYAIAHRERMMEAMMEYAIQRTRETLALAVQAGSLRPAENGVGPAPEHVPEDPRSWSLQRRKEMKERVRRGERIAF